MDITALSAAISSVAGAIDLGKAAIATRDANIVSEATQRLMQQLLDTQNALLAHSVEFQQLLEKNLEMAKEVVRLKEALDDRARYTVVEFTHGHFALKMNHAPAFGGADVPGIPELNHYFCQGCFSDGRKVVLQPGVHKFEGLGFRHALVCPICNTPVATS